MTGRTRQDYFQHVALSLNFAATQQGLRLPNVYMLCMYIYICVYIYIYILGKPSRNHILIYIYIHKLCHLLYSPNLNRTSFGTRFLSYNYASNVLRYFPSPTSVPCKGVSSIMRHDDNSSSATTQRFQFRRGW